MTEENTPYDRRTDHGKYEALEDREARIEAWCRTGKLPPADMPALTLHEVEDRRTDHGKRGALMRLRLAEEKVMPLLEELSGITRSTFVSSAAYELSAAIDGLVNTMRQTPPEGV